MPSLPPSFLSHPVQQQVKEVQTLEETEAALNEAGGKLVVLDFTATWYGGREGGKEGKVEREEGGRREGYCEEPKEEARFAFNCGLIKSAIKAKQSYKAFVEVVSSALL